MFINFFDKTRHVVNVKRFGREVNSEVKTIQIHHADKLRPHVLNYGRVNRRRKADEHTDASFSKARLNAFNRCGIKICRNALIYVLAEKA